MGSFMQDWVFPTGDYPQAEVALLDADGNYIIQQSGFRNANFYEFYRSYNTITPSTIPALRQEMAGEAGHFQMNNSRGEACIAAHTRVSSTDNWTIVCLLPMSGLGESRLDLSLIGIVSAGLLLLLIMDLAVMIRYNRTIQIAADAAERANRAKTDFLSTMSHDIRTPMNAIIGLTTIAEKNLNDPVSIRDNLHKISMASNHLLTLINDILDISKVESGKLTLSPVTFSIVESAENLVNISQPMVKEKNIDFNFRVNNFTCEYLHADQLRLNQILINLLSNAIKYTEPGGRVCVDLREEPGHEEGYITLFYQVADTGIGMSPEFMERMYQPFSRQTDSRVNSIQGTGLGLAITRQMIDLMHGDIQCESTLGKGTTFTVRLEFPVSDQPSEKQMLPPVRILAVDDDEILLDSTMDTLLSLGTEPETARSGAQAVDLVRKSKEEGKPFDAVILDWKMPDMDGIEAARQIRSVVGPDVPILLASAYDGSDLEASARDAGVNGFITKPLFRSTLYDRLGTLLGCRDESQDQAEDNSDIEGMNILVAEDNDINWEIISMLLNMHGITCERAENGQLAADRIAASHPGEFQLIFMDVQMPVLNGLDATRAIRALPDSQLSRIPIIAMTADAFSENVAECMDAGMNGHIAKPIDMKLVLREIRKIKENES